MWFSALGETPGPGTPAKAGDLRRATVNGLGPVCDRLATAALLTLALGGTAPAWGLASFAEVKAAYHSSDTLVLDRHGDLLQRVRSDMHQRRLDWVTLAEVSPALRHALLLSEDKRFYEHAGVDWSAVGAAAWANLWNRRTRGASTVTMQLAGLLDTDLATPRGGRSLPAKIGQAAMALQLERSWSKDQILEAYLNRVALRGEVVGIAALSATLFHKIPSGLDAEEAAVTAALVRAPNAAPAAVAQRACAVLKAQGRSPNCELLDSATRQWLAGRDDEVVDREDQLAPHLGRRVVAAAAAASAQPARAAPLRTTLDAALQRHARDTLRQHLGELREQHVEDGAVIVIDNRSGEVLAWVGSSGGELSRAGEVDGVLARRQAGSTLKPFLYGVALEQRWLTAASLLDDSPVGLSTAAGLYLPQNYDHQFKGAVSVRTALGSSLNVPAVRTLVLVTPERFAERLDALGLQLAHHGDYYGYSLALGSAEVTLASLANAYRTLANGGRHGALRWLAGAPGAPARGVMDPGASFIVADILADREARVPTFGLDNALSPRYWAAVKTGTSKDMRDNWCLGFSARYTVGVWVGNASGAPMWNVSGVSGAAPVWRAVMDELQRRDRTSAPGLATATHTATLATTSTAAKALAGQQGQGAGSSSDAPPPPPATLVARAIHYADNTEPPRSEWFLPGTEQTVVRSASAGGVSGRAISSPIDGSILALDPDIPRQAQQLRLSSTAGTPTNWRWRMDGRWLGPATPRAWPLWPGSHRLDLVDTSGQVRDSAGFEVRGVRLRPTVRSGRTTSPQRQAEVSP